MDSSQLFVGWATKFVSISSVLKTQSSDKCFTKVLCGHKLKRCPSISKKLIYYHKFLWTKISPLQFFSSVLNPRAVPRKLSFLFYLEHVEILHLLKKKYKKLVLKRVEVSKNKNLWGWGKTFPLHKAFCEIGLNFLCALISEFCQMETAIFPCWANILLAISHVSNASLKLSKLVQKRVEAE